MPLTAASNHMTAAQANLAASLAASAAFQAMVAADDAAAAAGSIHVNSLPRPLQGEEYTLADWSLYKPLAMLWSADRRGWRMRRDAYGCGGEFLPAGSLWLKLMQDVPAAVFDDYAEADRLWENRVGDIVEDLCALAGGGGYLDFHTISLELLWRPEEKHQITVGNVQVALLSIEYDTAGGA